MLAFLLRPSALIEGKGWRKAKPAAALSKAKLKQAKTHCYSEGAREARGSCRAGCRGVWEVFGALSNGGGHTATPPRHRIQHAKRGAGNEGQGGGGKKPAHTAPKRRENAVCQLCAARVTDGVETHSSRTRNEATTTRFDRTPDGALSRAATAWDGRGREWAAAKEAAAAG
ncbi:plasmid stabilization protein [Anopheles sinensis]|uniref:Plasmid stabilization protein n=1 Tax=Anopheles sinensis TaxID=74873 RepID=A0A084WRB0_ANOSI|nr:plasmid stabilization protein [Anopheles sinensis]